MTVEFNQDSYIVGIWFSSDPVTGNNWLAGAIRDQEHPTHYKAWSRFRYTKDDKIFDSEDRKSWTHFTSKEGTTEEEIIKVMDLSQNDIKNGYPDTDRIIVQGGLDKLMKLAKGKAWINMKEVKD